MSRSLHTSTVVRNFLYVIGGLSTENIQRARISPDGSLGPFATVPGVSLVSPRDGHTTVVIRDFLYVIGGEGGGYQSSVERAAINADGSLGSFVTVSGVTLNEGRFGHISVVLGDFLYGSLILGRTGSTNAVVGNAVYVLGGRNNIQAVTTIEHATINTDGSLSAFDIVSGIAPEMPRSSHTATVIGNSLYLVGGGVDILHSVEHAILR